MNKIKVKDIEYRLESIEKILKLLVANSLVDDLNRSINYANSLVDDLNRSINYECEDKIEASRRTYRIII
ncbi:hypothetical protein, partial [Eubacterium sp. AM46-8]|uniref:hypothetical protein n=1 Tax=Eubacterium sp. AM46-8 TaxID=2292350 RepID=UPI000EE952D3